MGWGLFGKLPQKRDFLALGLPRAVLEPFENWLQSAVAASRSELGGQWQELYLVAPIWRFWIGKEVFGTQCAGAVMPSVDGVGRFFPLSILWAADGGQEIPPPMFEPRGDWYGAIENRLLSVLDPQAQVAPDKLTEDLTAPLPPEVKPEPVSRQIKRGSGWQEEGTEVDALLATIVASDIYAITPMRSYWWTRGAAERPSIVYSHNALPDAFFYTTMIRGQLS